MTDFWIKSSNLIDQILIPKYYDPSIETDLSDLKGIAVCDSLGDLIDGGVLSVGTGDEIGKAAYGTGDIPFVRTSDISNWELKTVVKQGISQEVYEKYADSQDVQPGDIMFVRDGTYLIGTNCFVTALDVPLLYQSHILKIRVEDKSVVDPEILFAVLNSEIVQRQIRSKQFTADIIDTIGNRFREVVVPLPANSSIRRRLSKEVRKSMDMRLRGKCLIKGLPKLVEQVLTDGVLDPLTSSLELPIEDLIEQTPTHTLGSEFGDFQGFWKRSDRVSNMVYLPKYYDPSIEEELKKLSGSCQVMSMGDLVESGHLEFQTGDEIGKMAYGTGSIPFIRTSDFDNWEIKHDPKHCVSADIYDRYADSQDLRERDLLLVRDGTYLVGTSCIVTGDDTESLYCGGLYRIRVHDRKLLDPYLLLGLINSFIVRRQFRSKQFTRDVIDTLGKRVDEVLIPIPKSSAVRKGISNTIRTIVQTRIAERQRLSKIILQIDKIEHIA